MAGHPHADRGLVCHPLPVVFRGAQDVAQQAQLTQHRAGADLGQPGVTPGGDVGGGDLVQGTGEVGHHLRQPQGLPALPPLAGRHLALVSLHRIGKGAPVRLHDAGGNLRFHFLRPLLRFGLGGPHGAFAHPVLLHLCPPA